MIVVYSHSRSIHWFQVPRGIDEIANATVRLDRLWFYDAKFYAEQYADKRGEYTVPVERFLGFSYDATHLQRTSE